MASGGFSSYLIQEIGWDTRVEQAVRDWSVIENAADEITEIDGETETVVDVYVNHDVDVLWPERWSIEALIGDMITGYGRERSTLVWQRKNQNDPTVMEVQVLGESMLVFAEDLPEGGLR